MSSTATAAVVGAWPAPSGVTPNFTNPPSIGYRVVLAAILAPVIAAIFVFLRLYTKHFVARCLHIDDYCVAIAWVCALAYSILQICQTSNGSGLHIWDVPLDKFEKYIRFGIGGAIAYGLSTLFTKASILLFYWRLSSNAHFRAAAGFVLFVSTGYCLAGAFAFLYLCTPIRKYWDYSVPGSCVRIDRAFLAGAALNVATDLTILALPIWLLWPLRVSTRRKVGITIVLMTGSFVCAVSIIRLAEIPSGLKDPDSTWRYVLNLIWCIIEMNTGILCSCLPSLRTFVKHHFPNIFKSDDEDETMSYGNGNGNGDGNGNGNGNGNEPISDGQSEPSTDPNPQLSRPRSAALTWHSSREPLTKDRGALAVDMTDFGKKHALVSVDSAEPVRKPKEAYIPQ